MSLSRKPSMAKHGLFLPSIPCVSTPKTHQQDETLFLPFGSVRRTRSTLRTRTNTQHRCGLPMQYVLPGVLVCSCCVIRCGELRAVPAAAGGSSGGPLSRFRGVCVCVSVMSRVSAWNMEKSVYIPRNVSCCVQSGDYSNTSLLVLACSPCLFAGCFSFQVWTTACLSCGSCGSMGRLESSDRPLPCLCVF